MPDLFRRWYVRRILLETTPWVESRDDEGRRLLTRDRTREGYREVESPDSWLDGQCSAHYLLACELR